MPSSQKTKTSSRSTIVTNSTKTLKNNNLMGTQRGVREHLPCGKLVWGFHLSSMCLLQSWGDSGVMAQNVRVTCRRQAKRHWPQLFVLQRKEEAQEAGLRRETFSGNVRSEEQRRYCPGFPNPHSHVIFEIFSYTLCTTIDLKLSLN